MSSKFLLLEYEKCFSQLQFYDQRQSDLQKQLYSFALSATIAQFALFKWFEGATDEFIVLLLPLTGVVFLTCLALYLGMASNRLYFVYVARQINSIRAYHLLSEGCGFTNNQLYTSTDFPANKAMSVHTMMIASSALVTTLFFGESIFALLQIYSCDGVFWPILLSVIFFLVLVGCTLIYLKTSDKTADEAIHKQS